MSRRNLSVVERFADLKQDWRDTRGDFAAAKPSKFRKTRNYLGGTADAHYYSPSDFIALREYALAMDRDDAVIGQLLDRAADNKVRGGFTLLPDTGEELLNLELEGLWLDWASEASSCDIAGRCNFSQIEWLMDRSQMCAGDAFAIPLDDGRLQIMEADRCVTPTNSRRKDMIHGVLVDRHGKPRQYWFSKSIDRTTHVQRVSEVDKFDSWIGTEPNVFHVLDPKRFTQTRGITAFKSIIDIEGMFDDLQFAQVLKAQIQAMITYFVSRDINFAGNPQGPFIGARTQTTPTTTSSDAVGPQTETHEGGKPLMAVRGQPGEKLEGAPTNSVSGEFFPHVRLILRIIGANLGMPLTLVLMDTTETTFHGYRGELDQARIGFDRSQRNLEARFHRPCYRWKVRQWLASKGIKGATVAELAKSGRIFRHTWGKPGWRYVDPFEDARADSHRIERLLAAPSDITSERGGHYKTMMRRVVADNKFAIEQAQEAADALNKTNPELKITWRQVLMLTAQDKGMPEAWSEQGTSAEQMDKDIERKREERQRREEKSHK